MYATGMVELNDGELDGAAYYIADGVTGSGVNTQPKSPIGWLSYDNNGAGTSYENQSRVFLHTETDTALKIDAGGNISIGAGSGNGAEPSLPLSGGAGHIFLQAAPVMQQNVSYGTSLPDKNMYQMRNGQLFFLIDP